MSQGEYALARIPILSRPAGFYLRWWYTGWHYWQFLQGGLTLQTQGEKYRTRGTRILTVSSGPLTQTQVDGLRTILNSTEVYLYTDYGWVLVRLDAGSVKVYDNKFGGYELTLSVTIGSRLPSVTGFSPVTPLPPAPTPTYCETVIGTQVWLCKNWDAAYPASKVYDNDEANRASWGGLYTYDQIMTAGFCPAGWHVATVDDWNTLIDFVGDNTDAGGILKAMGFDYWDAPNTGATNAYNFTAKASGYMSPAGASAGLYSVYNVWTATPAAAGYAYFVQMQNDEAGIAILQVPTDYRLAVRFVKDTPAPIPERLILASFGGGTAPFAGFFSSYDDGLTWQISKTISEAGGEGAWWADAAGLTAADGKHYFVGQGYSQDCVLYDIDADVLYQINSEAGAASSIAESTSNGDLFIGAYKVGAGNGHGYRVPVSSFIVNTVLNVGASVTSVIYDAAGVLFGTKIGIYQIGVGFVLASQDIQSMIRTADGNIYAGADDGHIFKSEDNGSTWSDMGDKTAGVGIMVMCLIGAGRILFYDYTDLWITDDQFVNCTKVQEGGAWGGLLKVTDDICLAFNANGGSYSGAYRSVDNGSTWEVVPLDPDFTGFVFGAIKYDL